MSKSSCLNRRVFQALIANRPYTSPECLFRPATCPVIRAQRRLPAPVSYQQRRTFLGLFELATKKTEKHLSNAPASPQNLELALAKFVNLIRAVESRSRTPPNDELIDAIRFLFRARLDTRTPLIRNEVYLSTEVVKHLRERDMLLSEHEGSMTVTDMQLIMEALALPDKKEKYRSDTRALAELVHAVFTARNEEMPTVMDMAYTSILAQTGSALQARDRLGPTTFGTNQADMPLWIETLRGLIMEGRDGDFNAIVDTFKQSGRHLDPKTHEQLVLMFVKLDRVWDARNMFDLPIRGQHTTKCLCEFFELLVSSKKYATADSLARMLAQRIDTDYVIGSLILWHASQDPDPENLEKVVSSLIARSHRKVSMDDFNHVIRKLINSRPHLAQTLIDIAESEGCSLNGTTRALQLQHALDIEDYNRAYQMYESLLTHDFPANNIDLPILNRYITKLASLPDPPHELISRLTDNLLERDAHFDATTLAALSHVLLTRNDFEELNSLLVHRIPFYSSLDRATISSQFQAYITDPSVSTQRKFNAYELWRYAFPESSTQNRIPIMSHFFALNRPDLATLVFSHMRQSDPDTPSRPTTETYVRVLEGISLTRDIDGLQQVHNMLKLDLSVPLSTHTRNALMLAYISCQQPWTAVIDHFYKIMDSREGPTYSSFLVALRACEIWPGLGAFEARKIIAVMQSWDLPITKECYDCYVGAVAGQCEFEKTCELIDHMSEDIGVEPDADTLGAFYNAIPWQYRKDEVEKWAREFYPDLWEDLVDKGDEVDEEWEVRFFKVDRSIKIDDELLFNKEEWKPRLQRERELQVEPLTLGAAS